MLGVRLCKRPAETGERHLRQARHKYFEGVEWQIQSPFCFWTLLLFGLNLLQTEVTL